MESSADIRLPHVEVLEELGRGAGGCVYKVRHRGRLYALKVARQATIGSELERALAREAADLARVAHPCFPKVMEVGHTSSMPYILMELVDGETLAERLRRAPLREDEAIVMGCRLAEGLAHLHASGLVHADLHPSNIIFTRHDGSVRLLDFGFAFAPERVSTSWTGNVGPYAAPELHEDNGGLVDGRVDLYALGAVLHDSVVGANACRSAEERLEGVARALAQGRMSSGFAAILARLLAVLPNDRYSGGWAVAHDLGRCPQMSEAIARRDNPLVDCEPVLESRAPLVLVGREKDAEQLRTHLTEAARGHGQVLFVEGQSGVGKSALVEWFAIDAMARSVTVLRARCEQWDPRLFATVRQLVDSYLVAIKRSEASVCASQIDNFRRAAEGFAPVLGAVSPTAREVLGEATPGVAAEELHPVFVEGLAAFLARWTATLGPTLIVIDDVQWIDGSSRKVLTRAASQVGTSSVLYVLSARTDARSRGCVDRVRRGIPPLLQTQLSIGPLHDGDVGRLVCRYLGGAPIDPELIEHISRLSDKTPLSIIELLRAVIEAGLVVPHWGAWRFRRERLDRMSLPSSIGDLIEKRLAALPVDLRSTLARAAVIGISFPDGLLARLCQCDEGTMSTRLAEGRRAMLIEQQRGGWHRFVHERAREALLAPLDALVKSDWHKKLAELIDSGTDDEPTPESLGQIALHYASCVPETLTPRAFRVLTSAALQAMRTYDVTNGLRYFHAAERVAVELGIEPDVEFERLFGEAELFAGSPDRALDWFSRAAAKAEDPLEVASIFSRIAWTHQLLLDEAGAWTAIETAFRKLGTRMPNETVSGFLAAVAAWSSVRLVRRRTAPLSDEHRRRLDLLCSLYFQTARLGAESGKIGRCIQSALRALDPGERLGPSAALSKSYLLYAFFLTGGKQYERGQHYVNLALAAAETTNDPVAYAHALQMRIIVSVEADDFTRALEAGRKCIDEHGHWRELGEFATCCGALRWIESLRGRCRHAWEWVEKTIYRANQHEGTPVLGAPIVLGAEAALVGLGREDEAEQLLAGLRRAARSTVENSAFASWEFAVGVGRFTEKGDLGPEFEALVDRFYAAKYDPAKIYDGAFEFFVQVAHARVLACLRAKGSERAALLPKLDRARSDLRAAARNSVMRTHSTVIDAYWAWFLGKRKKAVTLFARAEALAREHTCPWVLYAVARGRAHMLREQGMEESALDQARIAVALAREHGAFYRAQWVRDEFGIDERYGGSRYISNAYSAPVDSAGLVRRKRPFSEPMRERLRALLRMGQATGEDLDLVHQARAIVNELIQSFGADRGFLFLRHPASGELELIAAQRASSREIPEAGWECERVIREVFATGETRLLDGDQLYIPERSATQARSMLAVPLVIYDEIVGVVSLDSRLGRGAFTPGDADFLQALSHQIPVAFELARSLRIRAEQQDALEREVTERKRSEVRYRRLIESAYDAICILDESGTVVEVNRRACELLHRSEPELLGRRFVEFAAAGAAEPFIEALARAHHRKESFCDRVMVIDGEGTEVPVEASLCVLDLEQECIVQTVLRDLRERERLESQLREAQKMEAVGRLARGIAHDFNNMMTAIDVSAAALRPSLADVDDLAGLQDIQEASRRASDLTRKLLTFSQQQVVDLKPMSLNQCLEELFPILQRLVGKNIKIVSQLDMNIGGIKADRTQVEQIVVNLAVNARDAMPRGGSLRVATRQVAPTETAGSADAFAELTISDTGQGMAEPTRSRIFEPFFTTKGDAGTGLGLATVYGIVQTHRGRIEVDSKLGEGTTFRVYLPVTHESISSVASDGDVDFDARGSETILLVEDEDLVREPLQRRLQWSGYEVISAKSGEQALRVVRERSDLDLIITDVLMPAMTGPQLVARVAEIRPNMKVLYMSGYTNGDLVEEGVLQSGVSFLHKPFSPRELTSRVRELLDCSTPNVRRGPVEPTVPSVSLPDTSVADPPK